MAARKVKTMYFSRVSILSGVAVLGLLVGIPVAQAAVLINISESGANVVATGSGTINLAALTAANNGNASPQVIGNGAFVAVGANNSNFTPYDLTITGPNSFGTIAQSFPANGTGDFLGVWGSASTIFVPQGYVSNDPLTGTAQWDNQSFASLGLTPGTYVYTWGSGTTADSLTVQITATPEPGTLTLVALGGLCAFAYRRRRVVR